MEDAIIARALHVLGGVLWIGSDGFVTTVLLPAVRRMRTGEERVALFEAIEGRFAWQARVTTLLVGGSGFYLVALWHLWERFRSPAYWWMHAMVLVWALFSVILFVAEPLFLHRRLLEAARQHPESTFRSIEWMHWTLLTISLVAVAGAVAGSHGWLFQGLVR